MKKITLIIVLILVIGGIYIFNQDEGETIKIGGISALTGAGAAIGEEERKGALLAIEEFNENGGLDGREVEFISEDLSIDKLSQASTIAKKLIDVDKVIAIVGPQWDEPAGPILPIVEEAQIPTVGADNSDQLEKDINYDYFFSTWYDNRVGIREVLRHMQSQGIKDVAVMKVLDGGFWEFTARIMEEEAPNYGVNIVTEENLGNPLTLDFKTSLLKVKQFNPEAIFIVTSDYNQCTFVKQMKEINFSVPTYGTESSGDLVSLTNCPQDLEGRVFSTPVETEGYKDFAEKYKERFGSYPAFPSAANAYDAARVVLTALEKTNGEGGDVLRDEIVKTKIKGAAIENVQFNEIGFLQTPENAYEMKTVRNGQFVPVE